MLQAQKALLVIRGAKAVLRNTNKGNPIGSPCSLEYTIVNKPSPEKAARNPGGFALCLLDSNEFGLKDQNGIRRNER